MKNLLLCVVLISLGGTMVLGNPRPEVPQKEGIDILDHKPDPRVEPVKVHQGGITTGLEPDPECEREGRTTPQRYP